MARSKRWVVDVPRALGEVLDAMGAGAEELSQGRVFVGRMRASSRSQRLKPGDVVQVFEPAPSQAGEARVLEHRDGVLAMVKPAGMPTIPDHRGSADTLLSAAAAAAGVEASRVHPTSRLDREVSGVVLFAVTAEARAALKEAREQGRYLRHYVAITSAALSGEGTIEAPIGRASDPRRRQVGGADAAASVTRYRVVESAARGTLLALEPETGRTHQLRVHMAHVGGPLLGDEQYGGARSVVLPSGAVKRVARVALHAAWVQVAWLDSSPWKVEAQVPGDLRELWTLLGGSDDAWMRALAPL